MSDQIHYLKIDNIIVRKNWNIRDDVSMDSLASLAESIQAIGLQNAIIVNESIELVAGYRRLCACKRLGFEDIKARVVSFNTTDHERLAHIDENLQTKTLSPKNLERALSERKAIWTKLYPTVTGRPRNDRKVAGSFEKETSQLTGQSKGSIRKQVGRVDLSSEAVRTAYEKNEITKSHVDELVRIPINMQDFALNKIIEKNLGIAETRLLILDFVEKNKMAIVKEAVKKFNEKYFGQEKEENDFIEEMPSVSDAPPEPEAGFNPFSEINMDNIENAAMSKRIDNHVKSLNILLVKYVREEAWHGVDMSILLDVSKDIVALESNIVIIKKALINNESLQIE